ncbi:hypothetical protein BH11PSE5_BH11PSE5_21530 [soil metagenome]
MTRISIGAIGLLVAVCVGGGSASYAISGINPFYYTYSGDRSRDRSIDRAGTAEATPAPNVADASLQTTQYSYGAQPAPASYDYAAAYARPIPVPVARRAETSDAGAKNAPAAIDQVTSATGHSKPAEELADTPSDIDGGMSERDGPKSIPDN